MLHHPHELRNPTRAMRPLQQRAISSRHDPGALQGCGPVLEALQAHQAQIRDVLAEQLSAEHELAGLETKTAARVRPVTVLRCACELAWQCTALLDLPGNGP